MSNEQMSDEPSWQTRLDQLGQLPGADETWKETAWDKLHSRLHGKEESGTLPGSGNFSRGEKSGSSRKKRVLWYWMAAAACLAFVVLVSLKVLRPGGGALEGRQLPVASSESGKPGRIDSAGLAIDPSGGTVLDYSAESRQKIVATTSNRGSRKDGDEVTAPTPVVDPRTTVRAKPEANAGEDNTAGGLAIIPRTDTPGNRVQPSAEPMILAAAPLVRQKLRVVYINELNGPAVAEPSVGHVASRGVFPIHLPFSDLSRNLLTGMEPVADPAREMAPLFKISLKN